MQGATRSICVLSTAHSLQGAQKSRWPNEIPAFKELLELLIAQESVDFIFEEASGMGPTTAENLIGTDHYLDVDPDPKARPPSGSNGAPVNFIDPSMSKDFYVEEYLTPQNDRETTWLASIQSTKFERALMICGYIHLLSVAFRLREAGFDVKSFYYMPHHRVCGHDQS